MALIQRWHKDCSQQQLQEEPMVARLNKQGRSSSARRFCVGIVAVAILSFLSASFVYACSGKNLMRLAHQPASGLADTVKKDPCNETKKDVCREVRDRMLSIQASPPQTENFPQGLEPAPSPAAGVPGLEGPIGALDPPINAGLSVVRPPLFLSYSVLRI